MNNAECRSLLLLYRAEIISTLEQVAPDHAFYNGLNVSVTSFYGLSARDRAVSTFDYLFKNFASNYSVCIEWLKRQKEHDKSELIARLECNRVFDREHYLDLLTCLVEVISELDVCSVPWIVQNFDLPDNKAVKAEEFLKQLPYKSEKWYWDLTAALHETSDPLLNLISPRYDDKIELDQLVDQLRDSVRIVHADQALSADEWSVIDIQRESIAMHEHRSAPAKATGSVFTFRNWAQERLAAKALLGKNSLICAPTNSGKTFIAGNVIEKHLRSTRNPKVAFLVPTTQLVDQQYQRFLPLEKEEHGKFVVKGLKGGTVQSSATMSKAYEIANAHVVCLTAAVLYNVLINDKSDPRISLEDFTLLVFDECHHTDKDHIYNKIMCMYVDKKMLGCRKLPQTLCLTASLGTDKALDQEGARTHVMEQCARLDVQDLSVLKGEDLVIKEDEVMMVEFDISRVKFGDILMSQLMSYVERMLAEPLDRLVRDTNLRDMEGFPNVQKAERWKQAYENWICAYLSFVPYAGQHEERYLVMSCLEYLRIYHNSLWLLSHLPPKFALSYLEQQIKAKRMRVSSEHDKLFLKSFDETKPLLATEEDERIPIVEKLKEILKREYKKDPNLRCIIFAKTRDLTAGLLQCLTEDDFLKNLKPCRLVSVNNTDDCPEPDRPSYSLSEQRQVLEGFRKGEHQVMIATTIAEEGLDIPDCNLVISYNHITNEIAAVQRRGRGRKEQSRSIFLCQDRAFVEKHRVNQQRESLMYNALERTKAEMQPLAFMEDIERRQRFAYQARVEDRRLEEEKRRNRKRTEKIYKIKCQKCDYLISKSDYIKTDQAGCRYIFCDPDIWPRLAFWPFDEPTTYDVDARVGRVSCGECKASLGQVWKLNRNGVRFPVLKIDSIVLDSEDGEDRPRVKKWKHVCEKLFVVDEVSDEDLERMMNPVHPPVVQTENNE